MKKKKHIITSLILILFTIVVCVSAQKLYTYAKDLLNMSSDKYSNGILSKGSLIDESAIASLEDSGITGEDLEFDENLYPYFALLNTNQQTLYKQIYANVENLETTFVPTTKIKISELSDTMEAVFNDHPELFWLNTSCLYKYTQDGNCVQVILEFNYTASNLNYYKSLFENSANEIMNEANRLSSNYKKEKYVHDAIIKLVDYDTSAQINQSAYSALVNHKTVCAGYARAFQYIMIKLGIPTYYVTGTSKNSDHAWNIVKLSDGYYNVDLTWDDQRTIIYSYFNISDNNFNKSHTRTGLSKSLFSCNGSAYSGLETSSSTNNNNTTNLPNSSNNTSADNKNSTQDIEEKIDIPKIPEEDDQQAQIIPPEPNDNNDYPVKDRPERKRTEKKEPEE